MVTAVQAGLIQRCIISSMHSYTHNEKNTRMLTKHQSCRLGIIKSKNVFLYCPWDGEICQGKRWECRTRDRHRNYTEMDHQTRDRHRNYNEIYHQTRDRHIKFNEMNHQARDRHTNYDEMNHQENIGLKNKTVHRTVWRILEHFCT